MERTTLFEVCNRLQAIGRDPRAYGADMLRYYITRGWTCREIVDHLTTGKTPQSKPLARVYA